MAGQLGNKPATPAGARMGKVPSGKNPAPGQMSASVASSAQGKKMQQAYGKPKGGIQGMESDLDEAAGPELELFKKLVTLTAQAQAEVDPNAPPVQGQPLGGRDARSTGNAAADKVLAQQGFTVK
jgi:hypothetical protein